MDYKDRVVVIKEQKTADNYGGFVTEMVEAERDMDHFSNKYAVSDHYVCYVKYADRIVKAAPSA